MTRPDTFDVFYRKCCDELYRALIVTTRDPERAADLLAESFARALERWSDLEPHPAQEAWVMRTAINLHRDDWRRRQRFHRLVGRLLPKGHHADVALPVNPELLDALWSLPERQRQVVAMRVVLDFDAEATAESLGVSVGTVGTHLHRALGTLRQRLDREEVA